MAGNDHYTVGVVGATGYGGAELVRILARHPVVGELHLFASREGGERRFEDEHPALRQHWKGPILPYRAEHLQGLDVVFLALPHGASGETAAELADRVGIVVDLSGDLRLPDAALYERWYGRPHPAPELAARAVYGLPEFFGEDLPGATVISSPGCYPTAATLALAPAVRTAGLCGTDAVVTAISGSSGAGRGAGPALLLAELHGNAWAYRLGSHQHVPEILRSLARLGGREPRLTFVPQVVPVDRGILAVASLPLERAASSEELAALYEESYRGRPFVRITTGRSPALREVAGTNFCDLTVTADETGQRLVAVAAIDNLVKGAAGQAVQSWNLAAGMPETAGLLPDPSPAAGENR